MQLVSVSDISISLPKLPEPFVARPHLIEAMESIFDNGADVLLVEGEEQIGKTVLATEFALKHSSRSFTLFLRPWNEIGFDPLQMRFDLCNQISWYLRGNRFPEDAEPTTSDLRNLILALQRTRVRRDPPFYFVVDGIAEIPPSSSGIRDLIVASLPLGLPGFRIVLTGSAASLQLPANRRLRSTSFHVIPFSLSEAEHLFAGFPVEQVKAIRDTCRGIPGRVAAVRRALSTGNSIENVLDLMIHNAAEIFEIEWTSVSEFSDADLTILACITFMPEIRSVDTIEKLCTASTAQMHSLFTRLRFLVHDKEKKQLSFVSEQFRRFAAIKLSAKEHAVLELAVRGLSADPDSVNSLMSLPAYLERSGDVSGLASYLSNQRIAGSIKRIQSTSAALRFLEHTATVFKRAEEHSQAVRFDLLRCSVAGFLQGDVHRARAEAALALGRESLALTLANQASTNELRLLLLVLVAKRRQLKGQEDSALLDQIKNLIGSIEFSDQDDVAIQIASELLSVSPELAGRVLQGYASASKDANALDRAFARATFGALRVREQGEERHVLKQVDELASTDAFKGLNTASALAWATDNSEDVLKELEKLSSTSEKMFLGRVWIRTHAREAGAVRVSLDLCRILLMETGYAPSATTFRDLALPILHAAESDDTFRLLSLLEGQSAVTRKAGPLVDHYRLRFSIFRAHSRLQQPVDWLGFMGEVFEIAEIKDAATKAACYVRLVRMLEHTGDPEGLNEYVRRELKTAVEMLLEQTAEHDTAVQPLLRALGGRMHSEALAVARRLNTIERRDAAYLTILREHISRQREEISSQDVLETDALLKNLQGWEERQAGYRMACGWVVSESFGETQSESLLAALERWGSMLADPEHRCLLRARMLGSKALANTNAFDASKALEQLTEQWDLVEDRWVKLLTGYQAVQAMVGVESRSAAAGVFFETVEAEARQSAELLQGANAFSNLMLLSGRAYAGLAKSRVAAPMDLDRLRRLATHIPGAVMRAHLCSRVAGYVLRYDVDLARTIINTDVRPVISSGLVDANYSSDVRRLMVEAAPVMWRSHAGSALDLVGRLDSGGKDEALSNILTYILRGKLPGEPWNRPINYRGAPITEEVIADALQLLEKVDRDHTLVSHLQTICQALKDRKIAALINVNQRAYFLQRIEALSLSKLPDKSRIQHRGYQLLMEAEVLSVRAGTRPQWDAILAKVRALPNWSDACFVSLVLVELVPQKMKEVRRSLFEYGTEQLFSLPTYEDRLLRATTVMESCMDTFPLESRKVVAKIFNEFSEDIEESIARRRERLIEMAHRVDEEWAASLVSSLDTDPARLMIKSNGEKKLEELVISQELSSEGCDWGAATDLAALAKASWKQLGTLQATGVTLRSYRDCRHLIGLAARESIENSYPILAFGIESVVQRYGNTPSASDYLRPLLEASLGAAETLALLAGGGAPLTGSGTERVLEEVRTATGSIDVIIGVGQREMALEAVRLWLASVQPSGLTIVDPYFGPDDLDALLLVQQVVPGCRIRVLTSKRHQPPLGTRSNYQELYSATWRSRHSLAEPPDAFFCIAGDVQDGDITIHDRWWIAEEAALDFGTSWNSVGITKVSTIRSVDLREAQARRDEIEPYFQMRQPKTAVRRFVFNGFSLE